MMCLGDTCGPTWGLSFSQSESCRYRSPACCSRAGQQSCPRWCSVRVGHACVAPAVAWTSAVRHVWWRDRSVRWRC